jgi:polyisoprenoid-binding protein YceI
MNARHHTLLLSLGLLALVGCKNPADSAPQAEVKQAAAPEAAEAPTPGHEALPISHERSKVEFVGSKVTGKHEGGFERFTGTLHFDPSQVDASRIEVDIDTTSIWSDNERLTRHLKSDDFFLVEKYPTARFVSTGIRQADAEGATHVVTGNLTLRGVTREVVFPATIKVTDEAVHARAEFSLPRKQFGVAYEGKQDDLIRDEVLIRLDVTAPRTGAGGTAAEQ